METRQTTDTQVSQLTKNKLKSTLDLSFADVNLSQAKLLLLDAENNLARDDGSTRCGSWPRSRGSQYDLVMTRRTSQPPPPDVDQLVQLGLQQTTRSAGARISINRQQSNSATRSAIKCFPASVRLELRAACRFARDSTM